MLDILSLIQSLCENISSPYGYALIFSLDDKVRLYLFQNMKVKAIMFLCGSR